jgi:hypothetical protein
LRRKSTAAVRSRTTYVEAWRRDKGRALPLVMGDWNVGYGMILL